MEQLSGLRQGECAILCEMSLEASFVERMSDLGLIPGRVIRCAFIAPSGSPMAFGVKGTIIALRKNACDHILVKRVSD